MVTDSGNYDVDIFAAAKSLHSCPTLCNPIDSSPPGSPVPGILQARILSGLPFPSPMHESEKWKWSCSVVSDSLAPHGLKPARLFCPWGFSRQEYWWLAISFSRGSSQPRDQTQVSHIAGRFFTIWATREAIIGNARLDEAQAGIKIAGRNTNNLRYADDTTLIAETEEELKSLLLKVKRRVKKLA